MKFIYSTHYQDGHDDYATPDFLAFCQFIIDHSEPPTLRQIKAVFPNKSFDKMLDRLIAKELIKREHRRYHLNFPIFSKTDQADMLETLSKQVEAFTDSWLLRICSHQQTIQYFYACDDNIPQPTIFEWTHPTFQWITVSQADWPKSIPAFLAANQRQQNVAVYQALTDLIGDVDRRYYSDQVSVIFERIKKEKKIRQNIFLRSLQLTGIVSLDEQPLFLVRHPDMMHSSEDTWFEGDIKTLFFERLLLAQMLDGAVSQDTIFLKIK